MCFSQLKRGGTKKGGEESEGDIGESHLYKDDISSK